MSQVYENLWIAPANVAREKDFLTGNDITVILNCAEEESMNYETNNSNTLAIRIPLIDDEEPDALLMIKEGAVYIQMFTNMGKNIVVHCKAGISRSATVILAWMIIYKNMKFDEAYRCLAEKRPIIRPNDFYISLLKHLEDKFYAELNEPGIPST